jgi:hypothetical protein
MNPGGSKSLPTIGFLTICQHAERGLFGGYLVLNLAGRPLEFHCTAPVRPSRAQEILYGPTLKPFLFGEQIGWTLFNKAASRPLFVCTDVEPAMSLRDQIDIPMVLVLGDEMAEPDETGRPKETTVHRVDGPHACAARPGQAALLSFRLGRCPVAVAPAHAGDREELLHRWPNQADGLDLGEPFARIREAIEEAQRAPGRTPA